jgi:hypothetical protein
MSFWWRSGTRQKSTMWTIGGPVGLVLLVGSVLITAIAVSLKECATPHSDRSETRPSQP